LDAFKDKQLHHTNRFSPGYCGWHVREQKLLFSTFPLAEPCGVKLTDSCLMLPIKSVSGVIGIGENVRKLEYTCGLCDYANCYKRRKKKA
ncbi:MAG: methionine synthase, partial [Bacteroidaceae bacterium]|nr:methionine synthase [Bacteroidaceae bacterium]